MIYYENDVDSNIKESLEYFIGVIHKELNNFYKVVNDENVDFYFYKESYEREVKKKYPNAYISEGGVAYTQETIRDSKQAFDVFFKIDNNFESEYKQFLSVENQTLSIFNAIAHELTHVCLLQKVPLQDNFFRYGNSLVTTKEKLIYKMFRVIEEYAACGQGESFSQTDNYKGYANLLYDKITEFENKVEMLKINNFWNKSDFVLNCSDLLTKIFVIIGYYSGSLINIENQTHFNLFDVSNTYIVSQICKDIHSQIINETFNKESLLPLLDFFIEILQKICNVNVLE